MGQGLFALGPGNLFSFHAALFVVYTPLTVAKTHWIPPKWHKLIRSCLADEIVTHCRLCTTRTDRFPIFHDSMSIIKVYSPLIRSNRSLLYTNEWRLLPVIYNLLIRIGLLFTMFCLAIFVINN